MVAVADCAVEAKKSATATLEGSNLLMHRIRGSGSFLEEVEQRSQSC